MAIGARVRAAFGPYEPMVSNLWRKIFIDLDEWTQTLSRWSVGPRRILEVGCGEGYSTARLAAAFPDCTIDAIDIAANIGRLYDGPPDRVRFKLITIEEFAKENPASYDLIVLTDVLHHIPASLRVSVLTAIRDTLAPGGVLAFKDWARAPLQPIHWLVHGSDRWLTGDRVQYLRPTECRTLLTEVFGPSAIEREATIRPWRNNYAFRVVKS